VHRQNRLRETAQAPIQAPITHAGDRVTVFVIHPVDRAESPFRNRPRGGKTGEEEVQGHGSA